MERYLKLKKSNCKNCYKCIRHCPVKSIKFSDNQAHIVSDECILCGKCFVECPQNAKEIRNDTQKAKMFIEEGYKTVVSIAPSFVTAFPDMNFATFKNAMLRLGFYDVRETAVGAAVVKNRYDEMLSEGNYDVIISSCCHSVNLLIQKYYPEALKYLAPVLSPMQTHCKMIKDEIPEVKTVFIGPCIAKKEEADRYSDYVDCVLTFDELSSWMNEQNVEFEYAKDVDEGGKTRLFPTAGGILRSMKCEQNKYTYLTVDGVDNCISALKDITEGKISGAFIEMSACVGSCIGGPGIDKQEHTPVRDYMQVNAFAGKEDFLYPHYNQSQINKEFECLSVNNTMPGSASITEILRKMGKTLPEHELNCGTCGYDTCRDKAVAVFLGKADLTMCLPFLKDKAESFSHNIINNMPNGVIVLNETLEIQQINRAALSIINMKNEKDVVGEPVVTVLNPEVYFEVMNSGKSVYDRKEYLSEYNKYIEQTVIYDKEYHVIMSIIRDITDFEKEHNKKEALSRQTIEVTENVIQKQMRAVQEIASLLGETTAETKIALTKLKESLENE